MEQNREPRIKSWHIQPTNIQQGSQEYPMGKGFSSTNGPGKSRVTRAEQ